MEERNRIILKYLPMIRGIAKRRTHSPVDADDLVQEGVIGLIDALERFDPEKSSLLTYGPYDVKDRMRRAEWRARWVRPGFRTYCKGGEYSYADAVTGWESIDKTPVRPPDDADDRMDLKAALRRLPARERMILTETFWNDSTQAQIASRLGVSIPLVFKLKNRALEKLRKVLEV